MLYNILESDINLSESMNFVAKATASDIVESGPSYSDVSDQSQISDCGNSTCHKFMLDTKLTMLNDDLNQSSVTSFTSENITNTYHPVNNVSSESCYMYLSSESGYSGNFSTPESDAPIYSVTAGSKPLSLILKRCSTPLKDDGNSLFGEGMDVFLKKGDKLCEIGSGELALEFQPHFSNTSMCISETGMNKSVFNLNDENTCSDKEDAKDTVPKITCSSPVKLIETTCNISQYLQANESKDTRNNSNAGENEKINLFPSEDSAYAGENEKINLFPSEDSANALLHENILFPSQDEDNQVDLVDVEDSKLGYVGKKSAESLFMLSGGPEIESIILRDSDDSSETTDVHVRNSVRINIDGAYENEYIMETSTDSGTVFMTRHSSDKLLPGPNVTCNFYEDYSSGVPCTQPLFSPPSDSCGVKLTEGCDIKVTDNYGVLLADKSRDPSLVVSPLVSLYPRPKSTYNTNRSPVENANDSEDSEIEVDVVNSVNDTSEISNTCMDGKVFDNTNRSPVVVNENDTEDSEVEVDVVNSVNDTSEISNTCMDGKVFDNTSRSPVVVNANDTEDSEVEVDVVNSENYTSEISNTCMDGKVSDDCKNTHKSEVMLVTNDVLSDLSLEKSGSSIGLPCEIMILSTKSPVSSNADYTVELLAKGSLLEPKSENEMRIIGDDEGKMCMLKTPVRGNPLIDQAARIPTSYETTVKTASNIVLECTSADAGSQNKFIAASTSEAIVSENGLNTSEFDRKIYKELNEVSEFNRNCRTEIQNTACTGNSDILGEHVPLYNADYCVNSPLLFASDDDDDDDDDSIKGEIDKQREEFPSVSADISKVVAFERLRLNSLRELLTGVPPPPSVTVPQHEVSDMLHLVKENHKLMSPLPEFKDANAGNDHNGSHLKSGSIVQEIISCEWPRVRTYQYFDVQYNNGTVSEEFEYLCQKLQQRYVGCETASSCNLWFSSSSGSSSGNARKRKSVGHSPGRRLSHLARRRRAFSSSNLQNNVAGKLTGNLQSQAPERRMIMVEVKKNESRKSRHLSMNNDPINHKVSHSKVLSSKRALFQSPTEMKKPTSSASQSNTKCKSEIERPKIRHSRRALFSDGPCLNTNTNDTVINLNGKRLRSEDEITSSCRLLSNGLRCGDSRKSGDVNNQSDRTSHIGDSVDSSLNHQTTTSYKRGSKDLSANHKKKLLWAVAEALKKEGIGITHPSFRHCASSLASLCRRHLLDLLEPRSAHQDRGSTSDRMLKVATEFVTNVVSRFTLKENVS